MTGVNRTYDCDCCGAPTPRALITCSWAFGLETHACPLCRGHSPSDIISTYDEADLEAWHRWTRTGGP
jgi:hypothetical protein